MTRQHRDTVPVLKASVDAVNWDTSLARIAQWAANRESRYVCICNAHSVVTAGQDPAFRQVVRQFDREAAEGRLQPFVIQTEGQLVGQMHLFGIAWGSLRSACAGYWVAESVAGQGIAPLALAVACDHAFLMLGLHRVEVNIRPENSASLRVVEKLGFREEGLRRRYLHIDGEWHDHRSFAMTTEDLGATSLVERCNLSQGL